MSQPSVLNGQYAWAYFSIFGFKIAVETLNSGINIMRGVSQLFVNRSELTALLYRPVQLEQVTPRIL